MMFVVIMGAAVRPDNSPSGAMKRRVLAALSMGRDGRATMFLATGGIGKHGEAEALVMRRMLLEAGVPDGNILTEVASNDTLSSIINCRNILRSRDDVDEIVVCSDIYHLPRCVWLFRLLGLEVVRGYITSGRSANGWIRWWYYWLRDLVALAFDSIVILLRKLRAGFKTVGCQ